MICFVADVADIPHAAIRVCCDVDDDVIRRTFGREFLLASFECAVDLTRRHMTLTLAEMSQTDIEQLTDRCIVENDWVITAVYNNIYITTSLSQTM